MTSTVRSGVAGAWRRLQGPAIPRGAVSSDRVRYLLPVALFGIAAVALVGSIFLPYWRLRLYAPQYPKGLTVSVYVDRVEGDVREIDGLNHYIGMRPLAEAAQLERSLSVIVLGVTAALLVAAFFVHNACAVLLAWPAIGYPFVFLGDLWFWLWNFGQHLDPRAPLSSSIDPFVPPILGEGVVGQFRVVAYWEPGLFVAFGAAALVAAGLLFHRRAFKPLVEAAHARAPREES